MLGRSIGKLAQRGLTVLLGLTIGIMPGMAGGGPSQKPLGTVAASERARLGGVSAVSGATVYVGDVVETDRHGALRLRLGKGQLYLSAASSASLEEHRGLASVTLAKGSATFSLPDPTQFEIETPAGTLRGSGTKATRGQVSITNPHQVVVTASHGDLVLDHEGDLYTIVEGKSFRIVIDDSDAPGPSEGAPRNTEHRKRKLLFFQIAGGALVATSFQLGHTGSSEPQGWS
jgi:FecR protein